MLQMSKQARVQYLAEGAKYWLEKAGAEPIREFAWVDFLAAANWAKAAARERMTREG